MEGLQTNIIANVGGNNIGAVYGGCGKIKRYLCTYDRALIFPCPNVKTGGMAF